MQRGVKLILAALVLVVLFNAGQTTLRHHSIARNRQCLVLYLRGGYRRRRKDWQNLPSDASNDIPSSEIDPEFHIEEEEESPRLRFEKRRGGRQAPRGGSDDSSDDLPPKHGRRGSRQVHPAKQQHARQSRSHKSYESDMSDVSDNPYPRRRTRRPPAAQYSPRWGTRADMALEAALRGEDADFLTSSSRSQSPDHARGRVTKPKREQQRKSKRRQAIVEDSDESSMPSSNDKVTRRGRRAQDQNRVKKDPHRFSESDASSARNKPKQWGNLGGGGGGGGAFGGGGGMSFGWAADMAAEIQAGRAESNLSEPQATDDAGGGSGGNMQGGIAAQAGAVGDMPTRAGAAVSAAPDAHPSTALAQLEVKHPGPGPQAPSRLPAASDTERHALRPELAQLAAALNPQQDITDAERQHTPPQSPDPAASPPPPATLPASDAPRVTSPEQQSGELPAISSLKLPSSSSSSSSSSSQQEASMASRTGVVDDGERVTAGERGQGGAVVRPPFASPAPWSSSIAERDGSEQDEEDEEDEGDSDQMRDDAGDGPGLTDCAERTEGALRGVLAAAEACGGVLVRPRKGAGLWRPLLGRDSQLGDDMKFALGRGGLRAGAVDAAVKDRLGGASDAVGEAERRGEGDLREVEDMAHVGAMRERLVAARESAARLMSVLAESKDGMAHVRQGGAAAGREGEVMRAVEEGVRRWRREAVVKGAWSKMREGLPAMPERSTAEGGETRTVYVGGMEGSMTEVGLRERFRACGRIDYVECNAGFGFVKFRDASAAAAAMEREKSRGLLVLPAPTGRIVRGGVEVVMGC